MIELTDWWRIDSPAFAGERCLADAADYPTLEMSRASIARMLVLQAADAALHESHPTADDISGVRTYLAALFHVDDPEGATLRECLNAVAGNDPSALSCALHKAARRYTSMDAPQTARGFGEISYEAALACGSWEDAYFAASILTRVAELDECHEAAERWEHRARVHERRLRARADRRFF